MANRISKRQVTCETDREVVERFLGYVKKEKVSTNEILRRLITLYGESRHVRKLVRETVASQPTAQGKGADGE